MEKVKRFQEVIKNVIKAYIATDKPNVELNKITFSFISHS